MHAEGCGDHHLAIDETVLLVGVFDVAFVGFCELHERREGVGVTRSLAMAPAAARDASCHIELEHLVVAQKPVEVLRVFLRCLGPFYELIVFDRVDQPAAHEKELAVVAEGAIGDLFGNLLRGSELGDLLIVFADGFEVPYLGRGGCGGCLLIRFSGDRLWRDYR